MFQESPGTKFVEYYYSHKPRTERDGERMFFRKMQELHRSLRDPTFDPPKQEHMKDLSALYIFPYPSTALWNAGDQWDVILPKEIVDDMKNFFDQVHAKGISIAFVQCIDGEHVEFTLNKS